MTVKIGASVVCMDPLNLERDIERVLKLGIDYLHLDVMDGVRVPRYGMYPEQMAAIHKRFYVDVRIDVHLMVTDPLKALLAFEPYILDRDSIAFHYDGNEFNIGRIQQQIIGMCWPTVVFNPDGQIPNSVPCGNVMLMGCHPGVIENPPNYLSWLIDTATRLKKTAPVRNIQVDGGVRWNTIPKLLEAGVNDLVCGSATLFSTPDVEGNYRRLRELTHV